MGHEGAGEWVQFKRSLQFSPRLGVGEKMHEIVKLWDLPSQLCGFCERLGQLGPSATAVLQKRGSSLVRKCADL